ncbi:MAG: ABC transporter permease, partial [Kistimonas sp.]|nr:ABC transporter permease [Kistimonas sp.]
MTPHLPLFRTTSKPAKARLAMLAAAILPLVGLTGLLASLLPAFGWSPVADLSPLPAWSTLTSLSGLTQMLTVTLITGLASTALSLLFVLIFACCCWKTRLWTLAEFTLPPLLCIPHTALAAGVSFLLAPTGVLGRLLAAINGWEIPPDLTTINDAWGLSLIFTLVLKEAPFLALMAISACRQIPVEKLLVTGQSLGYSPSLCWVKIVWTPLYRALRLPVLTVLIYSISVVDISMMTGPSLPPTLPVQILLWYQDPDLLYQAPAAAAVALLLVLSAIAVLCYLAAEKGVSYCLQPWITGGLRHLPHWIFMIGRGLWSGLSATSLGCLLLVALWSFITRWPFPDMLPCDWSLQLWSRHVHRLQTPLSTTLTLALLSTLAALVLAVTLLELGKYQTDRLR